MGRRVTVDEWLVSLGREPKSATKSERRKVAAWLTALDLRHEPPMEDAALAKLAAKPCGEGQANG